MEHIYIGHGDFALFVDLIGAFFSGGGLPVPGAEGLIPLILEGTNVFRPEQCIEIGEEHPVGAAYLRDSYIGRGQAPLHIREVNTGKVELAEHAVFTQDELRDFLVRHTFQQMMLWNRHGTTPKERKLHPDLAHLEFLLRFTKGTDRLVHSYSGFFDDLMRHTGLDAILRAKHAKHLFIFGLAGDFCVGYTALHAAWLGYEVYMIDDWCANIGLPPMDGRPGTIEAMDARLHEAGVRRISWQQLMRAT
ncbi:isochorismatase family protein [Candidatus Uhrbacteria bacterium]|nr:isochorismatase family protein [Candidatus Uhrbacteria bacterium]